MKNEELLLSNYSFILKLRDAGLTIKETTKEVNQYLGTKINYLELTYLIRRVRNNKIHKEYNNIVLIDSMMDAWDTKLGEYCVDFHGLLITYKAAAHLTNPEYIITPENLNSITGKESILYAKRILKLYHIADVYLLEQHKIIHPKQHDIDLTDLTYKIHVGFNNEFATMLIELRNRYVDFLTNNIKGNCDEK